MGFVAVRFDVAAADGGRWSDALLEAGALSVDAADPRAGAPDETPLFAEPADAAPAWWPVTRLTALCDAAAQPAALVAAAARAIGCPAPQFETFAVDDRDWVRATQAQFGPIRIGDDLWIVPSWCAPPAPDARNVVLDPGLAFGTGTHATTRLCLQWLAQCVDPKASVLDYGCGSGILAIAAAKLGASRVVAVDIDPQALVAARDNATRNRVDVRIALVDALPPERFSIVVANILAHPLVLLAPALAARVRPGGLLALSGILASQADAVRSAYSDAFAIDAWRTDEGWMLLAGVRRGEPGSRGA
ncbi:MAG: 50S ribosomal protein L11 methyltransferase [Rudaea sp.]